MYKNLQKYQGDSTLLKSTEKYPHRRPHHFRLQGLQVWIILQEAV